MRSSGNKRRLPNWAIGLILIVVIAVGSYVAYTKKLPWNNPYEVTAVFETAQNLRTKAPVRIAGVQVGEVSEVTALPPDDEQVVAQAEGPGPLPSDPSSGDVVAEVTMSLEEDALPLKEDAQFALRPRLFLEGNLFVDLKPGSPNAEEVPEGHSFSVDHTATSVQIDQVLTTLQSDVRADLQTFLDQFGNAMIKYGGAEGFQELYRSSAGAGKYTSQVNDAVLGKEAHDLSGLIDNLDKVVAALGRNEIALQNLVTNFRTVTGSFAAESASLEQAIANLPEVMDAAEPAFANLNAAFPPLRNFAIEALPGVRSTAPTLRAATPFISQVRQLVSEDELRGLVGDLRPTVPDLALLARRTIPFLNESRRLSSCFNEVIIPWSNDTVEPPASYPHEVHGTVAEETAFGLLGIAGESRSGDANGQYIRVQAGGGAAGTVTFPNAPEAGGQDAYGLVDSEILGATPSIEDSDKTPFKPRKACERQEQPDLAAGSAAPPTQAPLSTSAADQATELQQTLADLPYIDELAARSSEIQELREKGKLEQAEELADSLYESVGGAAEALGEATEGVGR